MSGLVSLDCMLARGPRPTPRQMSRTTTRSPTSMESLTGRVERSRDCGMDRGESTWEHLHVDRLRISAELFGARTIRDF